MSPWRRLAGPCGLACLLAVPSAAAPLPPALGRTPAQYDWSLSELRDAWTRSSRRIERFRRRADSKESATSIAYRLFAAEFEYTPVLDRSRRLNHLVLSDARALRVSEADVRAYFGKGRDGADRSLEGGFGGLGEPVGDGRNAHRRQDEERDEHRGQRREKNSRRPAHEGRPSARP